MSLKIKVEGKTKILKERKNCSPNWQPMNEKEKAMDENN